MKNTKTFSFLVLCMLAAVPAFAETTPSLSDQMRSLSVPESELPPSASMEKLYSVQTRHASLHRRHEFGVGFAKSVLGQDFVSSNQVSGNYRFHFNDHWSFGISGMYFFNSLSPFAEKLIAKENIYPDMAYVKAISDATLGYNLFYGKFRVSSENVLYFDQYLTAGAALVSMSTGRSAAATAGAGMLFWWGKQGSVRVGVKDYVYNEKRTFDTNTVHNMVFHLDLGILLGGEGV